MPFIKNTFSLLSEAAELDLTVDTEGYLTESEIKKTLDSIEETTEPVIVTAEMVPVINIDECLLTQINYLSPYMKCNGIKTVAEALDNVAMVNGLEPKSVGLLIESEDNISAMVEKANAKAKKTKNNNAKNKVLDQIKKGTDLVGKLKKDGYTVKKECSSKGCAVNEDKSDIQDYYNNRTHTNSKDAYEKHNRSHKLHGVSKDIEAKVRKDYHNGEYSNLQSTNKGSNYELEERKKHREGMHKSASKADFLPGDHGPGNSNDRKRARKASHESTDLFNFDLD